MSNLLHNSPQTNQEMLDAVLRLVFAHQGKEAVLQQSEQVTGDLTVKFPMVAHLMVKPDEDQLAFRLPLLSVPRIMSSRVRAW